MARPPPRRYGRSRLDGSYQVKRNGQWVASDASGQPTAAPLSGAPDTVGRRQEYTAGMKQRIAADLARLRSTDNLDARSTNSTPPIVRSDGTWRAWQPQPGQPSGQHGPELQRYAGGRGSCRSARSRRPRRGVGL